MSATLPAAGPKRVRRRFGLPFDGYTSSVPAHACPPTKAWGAGNGGSGSANEIYDPVEGKFFRRGGTANVGGLTGILEAVTNDDFRARKMIALESPSMTDGYPTHCVLYSDETDNIASLYVWSTNGTPSNYNLGKEFSSNHYQTATGGTDATKFNIKCPAYYRTTDGTWGRLSTADLRAMAFAGSRGMVEAGGSVLLPDLHTMPFAWNRRLNESTSTGSENLRLLPVGGVLPLSYLVITAGAANSTNNSWFAADAFFGAVAYQWADGSVSQPMLARGSNDVSGTGYNNVVNLANNCLTVTWSNIPVGPDGVVGRWILRSAKANAVMGVNGGPAPGTLFVTTYIGNNTETTYVDPNGSDLAIKTRPEIIRFDHLMQPPSRYISQFDGRFICGYTKPHPAALFLAPMDPTGVGGTMRLVDDNDESVTALNANVYSFSIDATNITFKKDNVAQAGCTIALAGKSLQQLVDTIHASAAGNFWAAGVVPGADSGAAATSLAITTSAVTGDAVSGNVRAFSPSYPGIAYFSTTYLSQFQTEKRRWFFTQGGAGVSSNLIHGWLAGNYRTGLDSWGILQGFAPLLDGCLIFFTKAIVLFRNIKSGKSGLDDDYHPDDLFTNVGCLAWDSIAYGDGWAGCLTDRGYAVFDGTRGGMRIISGDVYNPATGLGEWAYEISKCQAACGKDDDGAHFHAKAMGGVLYCTYRSSSAAAFGVPDRMLRYDFSGSQAGTGLDQVLRADGKPWGWSPPQLLGLSVLGEVRKSTGVARYGCDESNLGTTNGRIDQFETGAVDTGPTAVTGQIWGPIDLSESLRKKQAQELKAIHRNNPAAGGDLSLYFVRTDGTTSSTSPALLMPATGAGSFARTTVPLPSKSRAPAMGHQYKFIDTGTTADVTTTPALDNRAQIWGLELDVIETAGYR